MIGILGKSHSANIGGKTVGFKGEGKEARTRVTVVQTRDKGIACYHRYENNPSSSHAP